MSESYFVYIIKTSSNTLYTGQTNNLERRLKEHASRSKRASKYVRSFSSFEVVYKEELKTRSDAIKREFAIKKMTRKNKDILISTQPTRI